MHIALFFGSFNPFHNGHIAVVQSALLQIEIDEIMVIVSPQNPFKQNEDLISEDHRLKMAELALSGFEKANVSDIEFSLPKPSYTINTLNALKTQFPSYTFSLLMGSDNLSEFHNWKKHDEILKHCSVILYKRHEEKTPVFNLPSLKKLTVIDAPLIDVSATEVRSLIKNHKDYQPYLPKSVADYIKSNRIYA